jgi:predicted nucleic acid-binding protein
MTSARRIVSNTGPLISLEKLHQGYDFIRLLYDSIIIPPGVFDEVAEGQFATPHAYLQHYGIVDLIEVHAVSQNERLPEAARLHVGEVQAIQLALELALPLLITETGVSSAERMSRASCTASRRSVVTRSPALWEITEGATTQPTWPVFVSYR